MCYNRLGGLLGLNPLKRVNSILTLERATEQLTEKIVRLNPLKRVNSILTRIVLSSRVN